MILHVPYPVLVRVCPYLTALSVYLAINRPQGHRLSVCCIKWPGQESYNYQEFQFVVCYFEESSKSYQTEKLRKAALFLDNV